MATIADPGVSPTKGDDIRTTAVGIRDSDQEDHVEKHRQHLLGIKLPRYFDKDEDRRLVRKLDLFLLTYTTLSCFMQTLDNTNIFNAYVSGMKDDLSLFGNELNYFSTTFNCGIIAGAVPLMLLSTHVRPSIILPTCELAWTFLVMGIAGAKTAGAVYGLRFAIGFFRESRSLALLRYLAHGILPLSWEVTLAIDRMERVGRQPIQKITWSRFKGIWTTWHVYLFVICYFLYGAFSWGDGYFNLWLQSLGKYTVPQLNNIPTAGQGAALINSIISGIVSDWLQNRPVVIVANMLLCLAGNAFVAVWEAPEGLKFTGYILITAGLPAQSITIAWLNEVCQGNGALRGLIVSIGNTMVYAINAWALVLLFPAVDAPHYDYGYQVCAGMIGLAIVTVGVILFQIKRDLNNGKAIRNDEGLLEFKAWTAEDRDDQEEQASNPSHA
uniref:Major facilitator superfamily (MFS) profile domain-containing protein n=1 Tax=Bionectria ochroleuca TaxID=29856 RepID=A0A8H7N8T9_BIOOC